MKRAIGAAALSGGLLALSAGAASAQDVAADVSANLGRPTSAEVRVCADGRVLSGLLGSCSGSGTRASVQAGRDNATGVRARARVPRTAEADVSIGARRSRPTASGQASTSRPRSTRVDADASATTSPRARADASASLTRRARPLLDLDATASLAGVGLLGSSPFTLVGDPATDNLLPTGELTLDGLAGEAPAGIGVLDTGPIASGNQVGVDVGDVSPSVPVTVCGNSVGVLGDASASCAPAAPSAGSTGSTGTGSTGTSAGTGSPAGDSLLGNLGSGNQVDAGIGGISPSVPVTVCGNGVGVLGDASAACGTGQPAANGGSTGSNGSGSTGASAGTGGSGSGSLLDGSASGNQVDAGVGSISPSVPVTVCGNSVGALGDASASCGTGPSAGSGGGASAGASGSTQADGTLAGNQAQVSVGDVAATVPVTASCNSVGLLGDASSTCGTSTTSPGTGPSTGTDAGVDIDVTIGTSGTGTDPGTGTGVDTGINTGADTSTGGIIAPPPGTTPDTPGRTDTAGTDGTPGSTGTSGIPGTLGLTPGSGDADGSATAFAPARPSVAGSGALPFTGAASDLLAIAALGLLIAGALVVRATRPAAATEGGGDR